MFCLSSIQTQVGPVVFRELLKNGMFTFILRQILLLLCTFWSNPEFLLNTIQLFASFDSHHFLSSFLDKFFNIHYRILFRRNVTNVKHSHRASSYTRNLLTIFYETRKIISCLETFTSLNSVMTDHMFLSN